MEQAPADARAAPIAAGPTNMDTTDSLSPKHPRGSALGKKVSQRAIQNRPGEPENQSSAHEAACQTSASTNKSLAHHATLMGGRLKFEVDRALPWVEHLVHSTIFKPAVRQTTGSISCRTTTSRSGQVPPRSYIRAAAQMHDEDTYDSEPSTRGQGDTWLDSKWPTGEQTAESQTESTHMTHTPHQGGKMKERQPLLPYITPPQAHITESQKKCKVLFPTPVLKVDKSSAAIVYSP
jgi:hypothetical protein